MDVTQQQYVDRSISSALPVLGHARPRLGLRLRVQTPILPGGGGEACPAAEFRSPPRYSSDSLGHRIGTVAVTYRASLVTGSVSNAY